MNPFHRISIWIFLQFMAVFIFAQTTYTSVQSGDWNDPATWGLINGDPTGGDGTVENEDIINIIHEIDYNLAHDLDIIEGEVNISHKFTVVTDQNITVREDGVLTCTNGTLTIPITETDSNTNGNLQVYGGISYFENATIEIDHDWEGTDGAMRTAVNCCLLLGRDFINHGAIDEYTDFCVEFGLHGSGDFLNSSSFGSIDCSFCTLLDRGAGNLENTGEFTGDQHAITIFHITGNVINDGSWTAGIDNYCIGNVDDGPPNNMSGINLADFTDDLPGSEFCILAMNVSCSCPDFNPPAPVSFLYFRGEAKNNKTKLEWATSQEINNKGFEIQRSKNGQVFETIGFVDGNGTVSFKRVYQFIDMTPFVGNNIYRLRQVDFNGSFKYSNLVSIPIESRMNIEAIPNPTRAFELSLLYFNDDASALEILIFDLQGALIFKNEFPAKSGGNTIDLSDLHLMEGIYFVQARAGIHTSSTKFMIIK